MAPDTAKGVKRKRADDEGKIIVVIDFGTTFSGIGWVHTGVPDSPEIIKQWPYYTSDSGNTDYKVPTQVAYGRGEYRWGFQIPESEKRHTLFKLCLNDTHDFTTGLMERYPDPQAAPPGYDYDPERMVTDFLRSLREHFERTVRKQMPESALKSTPVEYIMTVPAIWSDAAKEKTRACAEKAGLGQGSKLHMISEPEAAAIHALYVSAPNDIKEGDTFILCDCGGGTCDLISYTVKALKPILKVEEASPGSGSLCGSSFLNRRFREFLQQKYSEQPGWDDDVLEDIMERFEKNYKRAFTGAFSQEFMVKVPSMRVDNPALGIIQRRLCITGEELRGVFEPILNEISKLVRDQITACQRPVKAVLMAGGFGSNDYLYATLRQEVQKHNMQVIRPQDSETSIIRGGLLKGLATTSSSFAKVHVTGRSARKHYGVEVEVPYDSKEHDSARKYWDFCDGFHRVSIMDWFVEKGETVKEDIPLKIKYHQIQKVAEGPLKKITSEIYVCSDLDNKGAPLYEDENATKLVEVTANLGLIATFKIPTIQGADGHMYYRVDYEIAIIFNSGDTVYELVHDNINYGRVASEYV